MTVSQMTDDVSQRRKCEQILRGILGSLFARKDSQRGFTSEQRVFSARVRDAVCVRLLSSISR
jgi:hypothetical protein